MTTPRANYRELTRDIQKNLHEIEESILASNEKFPDEKIVYLEREEGVGFVLALKMIESNGTWFRPLTPYSLKLRLEDEAIWTTKMPLSNGQYHNKVGMNLEWTEYAINCNSKNLPKIQKVKSKSKRGEPI